MLNFDGRALSGFPSELKGMVYGMLSVSLFWGKGASELKAKGVDTAVTVNMVQIRILSVK